MSFRENPRSATLEALVPFEMGRVVRVHAVMHSEKNIVTALPVVRMATGVWRWP